MIRDLDKETIDFLCKHKLTFTQFAICLLIHKQDVATIIKITQEVGFVGTTRIKRGDTWVLEIQDLIDRKFIVNNFKDKDEEFALDNFELTNKFKDGFIFDEDEMAMEVFKLYPKHLYINGATAPAKAADIEEFTQKYIKAINGNLKTHKKVLEHIAMIKRTNNNYALMGIMKYVGSRDWEEYDNSVKAVTSRRI